MKMKKVFTAFLLVAFAALALIAGSYMVKPAQAQTSGPSIGLTFAPTLSGCVATGQNTLCFFGSSTAPSAAVSIGGGAFVALNAAPASTGVASFNTRTGSVSSATGDYNFAQLSGALVPAQMPANQKCNLTLTLSAPTSGTSTNQLSGTAQIGGCQ